MTIDYAHPLPADLYDSATQPDVLEYIRDNMIANAKWLEGMDPAGKQTGFKRINSGLLEEWNGTAWVSKALGYVPKTGATDITGSLGMQTAGFGGYQVQITDAPANKKKTMMAGQSDGQSYFGQLNDAGSTWTAGMKIGADGKAYDIASGLPFVTTNPVGAYLPLTGGTLTGPLTVNGGAISISGSAGTPRVLYFLTAGANRWVVQTNVGAETGGNVGSPFTIDRFSDTGTYLGTPFTINRNDGWVTFANSVTINGPLTLPSGITAAGVMNMNGTLNVNSNIELGANATGSTPFIDFHSSSSTMNDYDGRIIGTGGGSSSGQGILNYQAASHGFTGGINVTGQSTFTDTQGRWSLSLMAPDGWRKNFSCISGGTLSILNSANTLSVAEVSDGGSLNMMLGYRNRAGRQGATTGNDFNFYWTGSVLQAWVDNSNVGNISDERVKHRIEPMPLLTEDTFARIKPIRFHWADVGIFKDDGRPHWGFSAQNIKAALPEALVGDTKAVQENGDPQPASIDDRAILGQCVRQIQAINARMTAAGL